MTNAFTAKPKTDPKFLSSPRRSATSSANGTKTSQRMDGTGNPRNQQTPRNMGGAQ
jgi:hypothetical protein